MFVHFALACDFYSFTWPPSTCLSEVQHLSNIITGNGGNGKLCFPKMAAVIIPAHTLFCNMTLPPFPHGKVELITRPLNLSWPYDLLRTNRMLGKRGWVPSKAGSEKSMQLLPSSLWAHALGQASHHVRNLTATLSPPCWKSHLSVVWWTAQLSPGLRLASETSSGGKKSACNAGDLGLIPGSGRSPGEGKGYHSREFHGQRSLGGYSSWGPKESDTAELLTLSFHFSPRHQTCKQATSDPPQKLICQLSNSQWPESLLPKGKRPH